MQETLIAVHSRRATFDPERVFTAWLYAIARYKLIDHLRRMRRFVAIDPNLASETELATKGFEDSSSARIDIDDLLTDLPPKQARAIRHTRLNGLSVAEAATELKISKSDVKISVHRGLKVLMARISNEKR